MPTFRGKKVYRKRPAMVKRAPAKKPTGTAFRKKVLSIVNRGRERKCKVYNLIVDQNVKGTGMAYYGSLGLHKGLFANVLQLSAIAQGPAQDQRIGNQIGNCRLNIRGFVRTNPFSDTNNYSTLPYELHILLYKNKFSNSNSFLDLKQEINNVVGVVTGDAMNTLRPWNRDKHIIKKHITLKLSPQPAIDVHTLSENQDATMINPNTSTYPTFRRFSANIPIAKVLKYQDQNNVPTNDWLGLAIYCVAGDGIETSQDIEKCKVSVDAYLTYEDA